MIARPLRTDINGTRSGVGQVVRWCSDSSTVSQLMVAAMSAKIPIVCLWSSSWYLRSEESIKFSSWFLCDLDVSGGSAGDVERFIWFLDDLPFRWCTSTGVVCLWILTDTYVQKKVSSFSSLCFMIIWRLPADRRVPVNVSSCLWMFTVIRVWSVVSVVCATDCEICCRRWTEGLRLCIDRMLWSIYRGSSVPVVIRRENWRWSSSKSSVRGYRLLKEL